MAVRRKILTLTLIGLMAAFMGPICANAQTTYETPPTDLTVVPTDEYDTMPTFGWTCISGPTTFEVIVGTTSAGTLKAGVLEPVAGSTTGEQKWKSNAGTAVEGKVGYYKYTYKPETALPFGKVSSWQVKAVRAAKTKNNDDLGFDGTKSTATSNTAFSVFGNILLSMKADKAEVVAGKDTVTVTVGLDNSVATAGGPALATLDFTVTYNAAFLDAPDVTGKGTATKEAGKVIVKIAEAIAAGAAAGAADIVTLAFKAKEGGDVTFAFADVKATSPDITKATDVKTTTSNAATKVLPAATEGVIISSGKTPMLIDGIVALKVVTASNLTADQTTAVTKYAKGMGRPVGVRDAIIVLVECAKP